MISCPAVRDVHVGAVVASGVLFAARSALMAARSPLTNHAALRRLSVAIDTVLLGAALTLVAMLRQYPFVAGWLTVKVLLLVVYIALGAIALKRGRSRRVRIAAALAAIGVYLFIASVAVRHDPLGALRPVAAMLAGRG